MSLFCIIIYTFTNADIQVWSLSYHPSSGNIALGVADGRVEMWQTDPHIAPSSAPQAAASQAALRPAQVTLPAHACVRERLAAAQTQANDIQASLSKAENGLRHQMSREQELKRSIADLEAKRTHTLYIKSLVHLHMYSGEREASSQEIANFRLYCTDT